MWGQTTLIDPTLEKVGVNWPHVLLWHSASAVYATIHAWTAGDYYTV